MVRGHSLTFSVVVNREPVRPTLQQQDGQPREALAARAAWERGEERDNDLAGAGLFMFSV